MCVRVHGGVCEYIGLVGDNCSQVGFGFNTISFTNSFFSKINQNMTPGVLLCILLNSFELF